ncbi:hypothetical protein CVU37_02195 [candidate division BRC1 bacterium HGW-BRC1-1]|jgi:hypothetical protein|nr:MAG: hypothetical protein CVU37_02195 [candidate division BRC1 bacterium HGW-BRC1-1]
MKWVSVLLICLGAGMAAAADFVTSTTFTQVPAAERVAAIAKKVRDPKQAPVSPDREAVRSPDPLTTASVAGYYADPGPTKKGALSGFDLYLFPDETFIYLEWADIMPRTIMSKGAWALENGYVALHDDGETSKPHERQPSPSVWLPLVVDLGTTQIPCLMDGQWWYGDFMENPRESGDPSSIIWSSLEKSSDLPISETTALKADLKRKHWRPHYLAGDGLEDEGTVW